MRGKNRQTDYSVALAGNPNVGKSTIFNALTGLNRHTGNWTGKTVDCGFGIAKIGGKLFKLTDLPGTYSLNSFSEEERIAKDFLLNNNPDCVIITLNSNAIERNLSFALEVLALKKNAVVCLNLSDEAEKNGISIDSKKLSDLLGVPVIKTSAVKKDSLKKLKSVMREACEKSGHSESANDLDTAPSTDTRVLHILSRQICEKCVTKSDKRRVDERTARLDKILTSKATGIPIMLALFALLFWITAIGANYPSELLGTFFDFIKQKLYDLFELMNAPSFLTGILIDGIYTTLSWVVSVMLPPMAIFFPLFSLIEDSGYLPRIAFNLDKAYNKSGVHGKQSLTMAMGLGCNACGVTGCRIIESPKERLIAVLTNNIMPCNGRLPILIAIITIFFTGTAAGLLGSVKTALILLLVIVICVLITLLVSKVLSVCLKKESASGFLLELPPYRKPQFRKTLVRSILDRTIFVLGRAAAVAAPAGAVIWLFANIYIGDSSILKHCTDFFEPFGSFIGLDGVIVMAFILGFPANETVIPIMIMAYSASGVMSDFTSYSELSAMLSANNWSAITAVCMIIMTILHFPCSTTCLTIKKETGSLRQTLLSMLIPTALGIILCAITANIMRMFL